MPPSKTCLLTNGCSNIKQMLEIALKNLIYLGYGGEGKHDYRTYA